MASPWGSGMRSGEMTQLVFLQILCWDRSMTVENLRLPRGITVTLSRFPHHLRTCRAKGLWKAPCALAFQAWLCCILRRRPPGFPLATVPGGAAAPSSLRGRSGSWTSWLVLPLTPASRRYRASCRCRCSSSHRRQGAPLSPLRPPLTSPLGQPEPPAPPHGTRPAGWSDAGATRHGGAAYRKSLSSTCIVAS
jgi:hypothetical protein